MNSTIKNVIKFIAGPLYTFKQKKMQQKLQALQSTPKELAAFLYKRSFGRALNWANPIELNEKIRWIEFNTDISLWTRLADKYLARFYVEDHGYSDILVKLYGVWDKAEEIDFETLPKSFVIKTNHGCGEVIIVKDKNKVDLEVIRQKMKDYLSKVFGYSHAEIHYLNIPRKIIAEELLPITSSFSSSMVDYKFYCINGEPYVCGVFYNRDSVTHKTWSSFYDMNWNRHEDWRQKGIGGGQGDVPCPQTFELMKQACRDLCKDMPFCRLDFYESEGKLYFGEFTFTPATCSGGSMNKKLCFELGKKLVLPSSK